MEDIFGLSRRMTLGLVTRMPRRGVALVVLGGEVIEQAKMDSSSDPFDDFELEAEEGFCAFAVQEGHVNVEEIKHAVG